MKTEAEKMRNVREQANYWNRRVDQILARIGDRPRKLYPECDDDYDDLREARQNAGYWNQILNHDRGWI